jgi:Hemolysins and related proteins containing CBS domains
LIQPVSEGEYIVDSRVLIEDISDLLGIELHSEDAERIGGLVYERLGRVPRVGDVVDLRGGDGNRADGGWRAGAKAADRAPTGARDGPAR